MAARRTHGGPWSAVSLAVVAILSALALHASMVAASHEPNKPFEPTDILTPEGRSFVWDNIVNDLFGHVRGGCNNEARIWFRMVFHDCGTFNRDANTGGCDGSLEFDEERTRIENLSFGGTLDLYRDTIDRWATDEEPVSMADTIIAGGLLGLVACQGPVIHFTPGREDATEPNAPRLLPGPGDNFDTILAAMRRASFFPRESVVLIGAGHTISAKQGGQHPNGLDDTPDTFDNAFFVELHNKREDNKLFSDTTMMGHNVMKAWIKFFALNEPEFLRQSAKVITKMINLVPRKSNSWAASVGLSEGKASASK